MVRRVFNIKQEVRKFLTKTYPYTWIGINMDGHKSVVYNSIDNITDSPIKLHSEITPTSSLCKIAWDLDIRSPRGFSSKSSESELGFSCFLEDYQKNSSIDKLSYEIWKKLEEKNNVINVE